MRELTSHEEDAIDALQRAFSDVEHGLWTGETIHAAETRLSSIRRLRTKGEVNWTPEDIDWLFFKAATTVGSDETVKFALARLVPLLMRDEISGSVSAMTIPSKLDYGNFSAWSQAHRDAALDALAALANIWTSDEYWQADAEELRAFVARHRPN